MLAQLQVQKIAKQSQPETVIVGMVLVSILMFVIH